MTTLGYFRNWRTKGLERRGDIMKRRIESIFLENFFKVSLWNVPFPYKNIPRTRILPIRFVGEILFDTIWRISIFF